MNKKHNEITQYNVIIDDIFLPEIHFNKIIYYPLTYIHSKILLKTKQSIKTLKEKGYTDDLIFVKVDFSFNGGGIHNTYCISDDGLIRLLQATNIGGLDTKQKKGMNLLLKYLGQPIIDEQPRFINSYNYKKSNKYTVFEKDCISETLKNANAAHWQKCTKCNNYYPLHSNFFAYNTRQKDYSTTCKNCVNGSNTQNQTIHPNKILNHIFKTYGEDVYNYYKNHDTINVYNHYVDEELSSFPKIINNKKDHIIIIEYLYHNNLINKDNITLKLLKNNFKLTHIDKHIKQYEIYEHLFKEYLPNEYPWMYPNYKSKSKFTFQEAKNIFDNYIKYHNIKINDIYDFDYSDVIFKSRMGTRYYKDVLGFVMEYYDNQYPAYRFDIAAINYWKSKENRVQALKYLIEEDMKIETEKIPLYLTITSIRNIGTSTMYTVLKNYYNSLYDWVNEVYPNVFDPKDFDINYMRNEFDSIDEHTIDGILRDNFNNVLYNPKHSNHTIKLKDKIPDWFVFTDNGVIIVEYFGLWAKGRGMYNKRTRDYIVRSNDKIEKYKTLSGYKFLYLFPEDMDNNYKGVYDKINNIQK